MNASVCEALRRDNAHALVSSGDTAVELRCLHADGETAFALTDEARYRITGTHEQMNDLLLGKAVGNKMLFSDLTYGIRSGSLFALEGLQVPVAQLGPSPGWVVRLGLRLSDNSLFPGHEEAYVIERGNRISRLDRSGGTLEETCTLVVTAQIEDILGWLYEPLVFLGTILVKGETGLSGDIFAASYVEALVDSVTSTPAGHSMASLLRHVVGVVGAAAG